MIRLATHGALVLLALCVGCRSEPAPLTVFAAASLTDVLEVLADSFEVAHPGEEVRLNVAATSLLARQIDQGAPADVFFSANVAWVTHLAERGRVREPIREPVANQLVVIQRAGAPRWASLEALEEVETLALADPDHVPAGLYAREALICAGRWEEVAPRVVPQLHVRAAVLAVRHGAADAAIVYASDMLEDDQVTTVLEWPDACAPDIRYAVAVAEGAQHARQADQFVAFVTAPELAPVWQRFGFIPRRTTDDEVPE